MVIALAWTRAIRVRNSAFDTSIFSDPAWDMLLDIYVSQSLNKQTTVSDLCNATTAPPTTALRWISVLERRGLISRCSDPQDKRRVLLELTAFGVVRMELALDSAADSDRRLGLGRLETFN
ncbi:MAG: MarR family transcriptional regulator [Sphingobium sp.]